MSVSGGVVSGDVKIAELTAGADGVWRLTGTLDFDSVPALFARTDSLLASGPVELDLSGVERANGAGVALLLEWRRRAHRRGVELRLGGLPEPVRQVARLSGVEPLLTGEPVDSVTGSTSEPTATL